MPGSLNVQGFDWDDDNVEHIAEHDVAPEEVEEVFIGRYMLRRSRSARYTVLGRNYAGRYLFVVVEKLEAGIIRVVTARDMDERERRLYLRRGK